jgi:hypothetical protein
LEGREYDADAGTTDAGAANACLVGASPSEIGNTAACWSHPMGAVSVAAACRATGPV